jgi:hypothetical protein
MRTCRSSTQMSHPRSAAGVRWMETTNARSGGIDAVRSGKPVVDTRCVIAMGGFDPGRITRLGACASRKYLAICSPYAGRLTDSFITTVSPRLGIRFANDCQAPKIARGRPTPKPLNLCPLSRCCFAENSAYADWSAYADARGSPCEIGLRASLSEALCVHGRFRLVEAASASGSENERSGSTPRRWRHSA